MKSIVIDIGGRCRIAYVMTSPRLLSTFVLPHIPSVLPLHRTSNILLIVYLR